MNKFVARYSLVPEIGWKYQAMASFVYKGPSMAPLFKVGDILYAQKVLLKDICLGDVVVLRWKKEQYIEYIVHRVISVKSEYLITQGDNNFRPDAQVITDGNLVGLVTYFYRQNRYYCVKNGVIGLIYARFILIRNYIWQFIKHLGLGIYDFLRQKGWIVRIWRPVIYQLYVSTDQGVLIKYCNGNRTVARWWPGIQKFDVIKPFDLVISCPKEPK